jgi:hypothetical protein
MMNHECDLLVVTKSGYCYEIEIKVSLADLKKDAEKRHGHRDSRIKKLYFSVPEKLLDKGMPFIPDHAGIITVGPAEKTNYIYLLNDELRYKCKTIREPQAFPAQPLSQTDRFQVARLGTMRIWSLKYKIIKQAKTLDPEKASVERR